MRVRLRIHGEGGWVPVHRETACFSLEWEREVLFLDAGSGMRNALPWVEKWPEGTRLHIWLSHYHLDHTFGLTYLPRLAERVREIHWYLPSEEVAGLSPEAFLEEFFGGPGFPVRLRDLGVPMRVHACREGVQEIAGLKAICWYQEHTPFSLGLRIGAFAYVTDTALRPYLWKYLEGIRFLLLGVMFWGAPAPSEAKDFRGHLTARGAEEVLGRLQPEKTRITHLYPFMPEPRLQALCEELSKRAPAIAARAGDHWDLEI